MCFLSSVNVEEGSARAALQGALRLENDRSVDAVMPVTFDPAWMLYRAMAPLPFSVFVVLMYLRVRRLMPFAMAHGLMDGGDTFAGSLWPWLR